MKPMKLHTSLAGLATGQVVVLIYLRSRRDSLPIPIQAIHPIPFQSLFSVGLLFVFVVFTFDRVGVAFAGDIFELAFSNFDVDHLLLNSALSNH